MSKIPFLRLFLPFSLGIILSWRIPISFLLLWIALGVCILAFSIFYGLRFWYQQRRFDYWGGFFLLFACLFLGWLHTSHYNDKPKNNISLYQGKKVTLKTVLKSDVKKSTYTHQFVLETCALQSKQQWIPTQGKILLKTKYLDYPMFEYGDTLILKNVTLYACTPPQLPHQFDYTQYLAYNRIYSTLTQYENDGDSTFTIIKNPHFLGMKSLHRVKNHLLDIYEKHIPSEREQAVAKALVLGYQDEIDFETEQNYMLTGSLHILAVSGMHVGLIYLAVFWGLQFIPWINRSLLVKAIITALLVMGYAFLSGASPSIMRAALMFSLILGSKILQRYSNVYNTLCVTAFLMLVYNPNDLFNVGTQLSFAAVLGIVFLHPILQKNLTPPRSSSFVVIKWHWAKTQLWNLTTISIAAQAFTLPISLFYFHQFPTYFLLSNLIVIPISTLALFLGVFVLFFAWIPPLAHLICQALTALLWLMNETIAYLAKLPLATLNPISVSIYGAVALAILVICMSWLLLSFQKKWLYGVVTSLLFISAYGTWTIYQQRKPHWVIFKVKSYPVLLYVQPYQQAIGFVHPKIIANPVGINFVCLNYLNHYGLTKVTSLHAYLPTQDSTLKQQYHLGTQHLEIVANRYNAKLLGYNTQKTYLFTYKKPFLSADEKNYPTIDLMMPPNNRLF